MAAVNQAYRLHLDGETVAGQAGNSGRPARQYPAVFYNAYQYTNIDPLFQNRPQGLIEFPIVQGRPVFTAGNPQGLDRVLLDPVTGQFVALMTHRGNRPHYSQLFPCWGQNDPPTGANGQPWGEIPVPLHGAFFGSSGDLPFKRSLGEDEEIEVRALQTFPHPAIITPAPVYRPGHVAPRDLTNALSDCTYTQ